MNQKLPVVRQIYWPSLIPQLTAVALLGFAIRVGFPAVELPGCFFGASLLYFVFSKTMRSIFTRSHVAGIRAYRRGEFRAAIEIFKGSEATFKKHPKLDRWRSLLFASSGPNSYRTMACLNRAFCLSQVGEGPAAMQLYQEILADHPECTLARTSLNMLKSMAPSDVKQKTA